MHDLNLSVHVRSAEEAKMAAREILSRASMEQWELVKVLAMELVMLAEAVDQSMVVNYSVVPRK